MVSGGFGTPSQTQHRQVARSHQLPPAAGAAGAAAAAASHRGHDEGGHDQLDLERRLNLADHARGLEVGGNQGGLQGGGGMSASHQPPLHARRQQRQRCAALWQLCKAHAGAGCTPAPRTHQDADQDARAGDEQGVAHGHPAVLCAQGRHCGAGREQGWREQGPADWAQH